MKIVRLRPLLPRSPLPAEQLPNRSAPLLRGLLEAKRVHPTPIQRAATGGPLIADGETPLGLGLESMHQNRGPVASPDPRPALGISVQVLKTEVILTAKRVCLQYEIYEDSHPRYNPPRSMSAPEIDRRRARSFVLAVDHVGGDYDKVEAGVAAVGGIQPFYIRKIPFSFVKWQDFLAQGSMDYQKAVDNREKIIYLRISVLIDWRKVFELPNYQNIRNRRVWEASVSGVERIYVNKVLHELGIADGGRRKGMIDWETIKHDSERRADGKFLLYRQRRSATNFREVVTWDPDENIIDFRAPQAP